MAEQPQGAGREVGEAVDQDRESTADRHRRERISALSGKYAGMYGPGYLDGLREDWLA